AQQVRWYLINKGGIKKTSLIVSSKGESEPLDSNSSKQGRNENKRIEIIFR
ncbi:MAG: OOP family OmpA-OmpF porin, partial [Flavobacteriaceae bacterium]